jgi:hypothetical protein
MRLCLRSLFRDGDRVAHHGRRPLRRAPVHRDQFAQKLPAGSTGTAAIYTGHLVCPHDHRATTNRVLILLRAIPPGGDNDKANALIKTVKVYPLKRTVDRKEPTWVPLPKGDFIPPRAFGRQRREARCQPRVGPFEAQLKLSDLRLSQMTTLFERDAGRGFDVQQRQSEVDQAACSADRSRTTGGNRRLRKPTIALPGYPRFIKRIVSGARTRCCRLIRTISSKVAAAG